MYVFSSKLNLPHFELKMTTRSKELNFFFKLRNKIEVTKNKIAFLLKCKKSKVYPKFIQINTKVKNNRSRKVLNDAKKQWLKLEINFLNSNLINWERKAYHLHLKHASVMDVHGHKFETIHNQNIIKRNSLNEKWKKLKTSTDNRTDEVVHQPKPELIEDFVINLSSKTLSNDELKLLNRGLNFIPTPDKLPAEDLCADIMSQIRYLPSDIKDDIDHHSYNIMKEAMSSNFRNTHRKIHETIAGLRKKKLIITKADKSNKVIVYDENQYERLVVKTIENGPYTVVDENPLKDMIKEVNHSLEKHSHVLCNNPTIELKHWKVSNPTVPRLYALGKNHKPLDPDGDMKMRPIASNINAPSENIAKKLSKIFNSMTPPKGKSVKNGTEFANLVHNMEIKRTEDMGSYDVTSLYPSIPIPKAMIFLRKWLKSNDVSNALIDAYTDLAQVCMNQNIFQFRNKFYKQTCGTSMGNSLSSFIAELFMCYFETELEKQESFPRFYTRFMDDIFAINNKRKFTPVLDLFNKQYETVKFTMEMEKDGKIPFLDTEISRKNDRLEVNVYRKPTSTARRITSDSHHDFKHKLAAYHSMAHFMVSIPLSEENQAKEKEKIIEIGKVNGYKRSTITNIINKHVSKNELRNISTFYDNTPKEPVKRIGIRYFPNVTKKLKPIFKDHELQVVHSNNGSLRQLLGSAKDKLPKLNRSGIYKIVCKHCSREYYGKTIRSVETRANEHFKSTNWKSKTAVGKHLFYNPTHKSDINDCSLVQEVQNRWTIECYESIHIHKNKHKNLLNEDLGNVKSSLLSLFTKSNTDEEQSNTHTDDTITV